MSRDRNKDSASKEGKRIYNELTNFSYVKMFWTCVLIFMLC